MGHVPRGYFLRRDDHFGITASAFIGKDVLVAADKGGNLTLPLLAEYLGGGKGGFGGELLLGFVAAVAVATILADRFGPDVVNIQHNLPRLLCELDEGRQSR